MGDTSLVPFDERLTRAALLRISVVDATSNFGASFEVPFQFPPRVLTDGKVTNWHSVDAKSYEPIKIFMGAESRRFTLSFEYVATGSGDFTAFNIANILRGIKAYAYDEAGNKSKARVRVYNIIGETEPAPCRIMSISISHGEEIVENNGGIFPLHTQVSIDLELSTQIADFEGEEPKIIGEEAPFPKFEWF